jgi:hypothetical protein
LVCASSATECANNLGILNRWRWPALRVHGEGAKVARAVGLQSLHPLCNLWEVGRIIAMVRQIQANRENRHHPFNRPSMDPREPG